MHNKRVLPKFPKTPKPLHQELKSRVNEYLSEVNSTASGGWRIASKALVILISFFTLYTLLVFVDQPLYLQIIECVVMGFVISLIGFNIMHDGTHGSFSSHPIINKIAGMCGSMLGASQQMWSLKHNVIHHTYTNVDGLDDDIDIGEMMRMSPSQKRLKIHGLQHIYFVFLYSLMYLYWVFVSDFIKYFSGKIGAFKIKMDDWRFHVKFWGMKLIYAVTFVAIPIYTQGWLAWLIGYLIIGLVAGFILSIVFQLAHTVEDTEFPLPNESNKFDDEFALHQIQTTANFATHNKFVTWCLGGLNFQIEHHLFPKVSHVHYPEISKIIKNICAERDIKYIDYKTFGRAVKAHVGFLRKMGQLEYVPSMI